MGFAVSAVAGVISYFETVTTEGYGFSSLREIVVPMLNPLTMIAAVFAWRWLVHVRADDEGQRTILRRAFVAFAIQYLSTTALVLFLITPFRSLGGFWLTCVFWFEMVGALASAMGLFLLSRRFSARAQIDQPVTDADVVS
jgi:hypothetical protein